jgi:putative transcriptional regulator
MSEIDRIFEIKSNNLKPAKGRLLLSEPFMGDYYFGRSVVLLAEHNKEGSFGVIINKPVAARLNEVITDFPDFDAHMFIGGPVETNRLFYLHTFGNEVNDSIEILDGVFWGGDMETIKELIILGKASSDNIRFFVGYSGWGANQLDSELKRNSWVITKAEKELFFNARPTEMWDTIMQQMGGKYRYWTKFPTDPNLN